MQYLKKLTDGLKSDIRNLVNFHASSRKSENLDFDWLVLDEKLKKSYVSWHSKLIHRKANSWEISIFCVMQ